VFTGRIFIYYEKVLTLQELQRIENTGKANGVNVLLRGPAWLTRKRVVGDSRAALTPVPSRDSRKLPFATDSNGSKVPKYSRRPNDRLRSAYSVEKLLN
jgi:hypothetical protein